MGEREEKISHYVNEVVRQLNEKYPGIVTEDSVNVFLDDLFSSKYSDDEMRIKIDTMVEQVVGNYTKRMAREEEVKSERHYDLNDMFDCRITRDTLHIHVVPKSVKEEMSRMGVRKYLEFCDEKLVDAFGKIADIIVLEENANIQNVFAVSPLLRVGPVQSLFKKYGFDVGMTRSEKFIEMFGTKKVGEATISREKFLNMVEDRKLVSRGIGEEKASDEMISEVAATENELEKMIMDDEKRVNEQSSTQTIERKSDNKVLVKTNSQAVTSDSSVSSVSNESGYGSVLGVVLVIISISFILAGLFIRMLS